MRTAMKGTPPEEQETKQQRNSFEVFPQSVAGSAEKNSDDFSVVVVFTTPAATLTALRHAAAWVHQLRGRLWIIVPQPVPYPLPLDRPCVPPEFRAQTVRQWCEREAIEARIEIQLCRNACECLRQGLAPSSLVVLGVRKSWWPFTNEARLVRALQRAGHQVLAMKDHLGARS